jgi:hypothetical protein
MRLEILGSSCVEAGVAMSRTEYFLRSHMRTIARFLDAGSNWPDEHLLEIGKVLTRGWLIERARTKRLRDDALRMSRYFRGLAAHKTFRCAQNLKCECDYCDAVELAFDIEDRYGD